MSNFKLSKRSLNHLEGVHPDLVKVVKRAIELTKIDFGVIDGVRTVAEQEENVRTGKSKTMKSKHLPQHDGYSHAVDLMAFVNGKGSWNLNLYDNIADAIKEAANEYDVKIRWGAAWHIDNIAEWDGTMEDAMNAYIDLRRSQGKRPFIDGPHVELMGY